MKRERGFALLLVFVMAAAVAITLYRELPRVAFESQRNKEQLLIDRGEQYIRGIQLYVRKMKSYPATIEQLEKTNQIRFLRKRYADPMTGKAEWRPIHINAGGVYIDSLVHKPPAAKEEEKSVNTFTYEAPQTGAAMPSGQTIPGFPQARPSERAGMPPMPGQAPQSVDPNNPQQQPQQQPQQPGAGQFPGIPPGVVVPPGAYNPAINPGGFNPAGAVQPGQQPGQPFPTGQPATPPMGLPAPPIGAPPNPLFPQTGGAQEPPTTPPGQNQALQMINNMLTNPRPVAQGVAQPQGMQLGGGIAGFASTLERTGIKIYNDMEKYNEWEFLYDPTKDTSSGLIGPQQQRPGQQTQQPGQQQQPFGQQQQPFGQQQQPFGQQPQPFGQQPGQQPRR